MLLMTIFGGSALVLAAIGIYGLMAYSVQHRTQEIGIRMALGAQADRVRWSIVGQGMTLVGVGIVIGVVAALYLATFLAAALYGVQARDPWCSSACRSCSPRRRSRPCGSRRGARAASIRSTRCATSERRRMNVMTGLLEDLKHALRVFRTSPVFAVTAVAAIALGIGTTTAIFSVVNAVVLKPVPFPEPDRIVQLQILRDGSAFGTSVSPAKFMVWRELRGAVFSDLAGFMVGVPFTFTQGGGSRGHLGRARDRGLLPRFRRADRAGRTFTPRKTCRMRRRPSS